MKTVVTAEGAVGVGNKRSAGDAGISLSPGQIKDRWDALGMAESDDDDEDKTTSIVSRGVTNVPIDMIDHPSLTSIGSMYNAFNADVMKFMSPALSTKELKQLFNLPFGIIHVEYKQAGGKIARLPLGKYLRKVCNETSLKTSYECVLFIYLMIVLLMFSCYSCISSLL